MIESQAKLPVQDDGTAQAWAAGSEADAAVKDRVKDWIRDLSGSQVAEVLDKAGGLVGGLSGQTQLSLYIARFLTFLRTGARERAFLSRYALHFVIVLLAVGVVGVSQVSLPQVDFQLPTPTPAPDLGSHSVVESPTHRGGARFIGNSASLFQAPVAHTLIAERERMQVITYTVQPNDNVWAIAQGFKLQAETVLWANPAVEKSPDLLRVGQELIILPVDGIYYTVQQGDTVEKLAKKYKTSAEKVLNLEFNELTEAPYTLAPGQKLILPDGKKEIPRSNYYPMTQVGSAPAGAPKGTGRLAWPARGILSQLYWSGHLAIDIANRTGTPILATDSGYVVMSGRDTWGYGNQVVIDHGNGFKTRYAHLDAIMVKAGQTVERNQQIGTMGNTGRSTGPHLHFEVIYNGVRRNPMGFLP